MVELPLPSVTRLPAMLLPDGAEVGTAPAANVIVWPLTVNVSPAATVVAPRPAEVAAPAVSLSSVAVVMLAGTELLFCTTVPTLVPITPPSVVVPVAAVVPPAAPEYSTLPDAIALVKVVVPRRSVATAPAIVAETFDLVE